MRSVSLAVRVRPAHRDFWRSQPYPQEWVLVEWPTGQKRNRPSIGSLLGPPTLKLRDLVRRAKQRWIIERDYEELKQELGLSHYEGRGWRGFHHHATLCIAAYGFLVAERGRFSPSARAGQVALPVPPIPPQVPSSGFVRCASSVIIPGPLQLCARSLPGFCFGNYRVVLSVELHFYNTVVLVV